MATESAKQHQEELKKSGYILPGSFYVEPEKVGESTEAKSGDGGRSVSRVEQTSAHGFQGDLISREQAQKDLEAKSAAGPESNKAATPATDNKAADASKPADTTRTPAKAPAKAPAKKSTTKKSGK